MSLDLLIFYGSYREGRLGIRLADYLVRNLAARGHKAELVDAQDGFLIISPEYNHGVVAPLKNALDTLFGEWRNKPVGFVGYGAMGGARAIEQLVGITVNLEMIPQNASGKGTHIMLFQSLDKDGFFVPTARHEASLRKNLTNLVKWSRIMQKVRETEDV